MYPDNLKNSLYFGYCVGLYALKTLKTRTFLAWHLKEPLQYQLPIKIRNLYHLYLNIIVKTKA